MNVAAGNIAATDLQAAINELDSEKEPLLVNSAGLANAINDETGTGAAVFATSPTLTTPDIGAATGTSLAVSGGITSSGTAGIGYTSGASVTQNTSKSTAVTINAISGKITMHNAALNNTTPVSFIVNNSTVTSSDVPVVSIAGGTSSNDYIASVNSVQDGSFRIVVLHMSGGSLNDNVIINFVIIKGASN